MKGLSLWSGIIALIIGLFLFIHPFTTTAMIGWIIAIIIFLSGFTSLFMYSSSVNRSLWYLLQGILSIVFGIILLSSSVMSLSSAVMTIVAYWILMPIVSQVQLFLPFFWEYSSYLIQLCQLSLLVVWQVFFQWLQAFLVLVFHLNCNQQNPRKNTRVIFQRLSMVPGYKSWFIKR